MANKTIGYCTCPFCEEQAEVRRYSTGKKCLYYYCENDGMITPNLKTGQTWMNDNTSFIEGEKPVTETAVTVEPEPEQKKAEKPVTEKFNNPAAPAERPDTVAELLGW